MIRTILFTSLILLIFSCSKNPDQIVLETDYGEIVIEVDYNIAPNHSENFVKLVREGFYNGLTFHRLIPGTLIQGGDPLSKDDNPDNDGLGGPGYTIEHEFGLRNIRGAVGAGRVKTFSATEKASNGSQFYICLDAVPIMDGAYTVFGKIVKNIKVAEKISWMPVDFDNRPKDPVLIKRAYVKE